MDTHRPPAQEGGDGSTDPQRADVLVGRPEKPASHSAPFNAGGLKGKGSDRLGDRIFGGAARGSGILLLVIMAAIAGFLAYRASIALSKDHGNFITSFD